MPQGFLLHVRKYRETSSIASFLTDSDGRVDLIVRVPRGANKTRVHRPILFCQYALEWSGKSDLRHLQSAEPVLSPYSLSGQQLYCGFYVNELVYRLLPHWQAEPDIFALYSAVIERLQNCGDRVEPLLREFELGLLDGLGYGLSLDRDIDGNAVRTESEYRYLVDRGLVLVDGVSAFADVTCTAMGADFLAISRRDFSTETARKAAKRLLRQVLAQHLGSKPLRSREFFSQPPE